jgi:hypothetical protein
MLFTFLFKLNDFGNNIPYLSDASSLQKRKSRIENQRTARFRQEFLSTHRDTM